MIERFLNWADERFGSATFVRHALRKAFPDHWSFMIGEINLYCFIVLVATGTFMALWFVPASNKVVYEGPYHLLRGTTMSTAYASTLYMSFEVNAGLLIRQIHHWAADVFLAGIVLHMGRIFFTASFRNPREVNWIIGTLLLFGAMFEGFLGYSLPDDLLSGIGLRIAVSILQSIPFIGAWAMFFLIGGVFPTDILLQRLFTLHVFVLPLLLFAGIGVHLAILWRQKHAQFPGPKRTEENVVGSPLFPRYLLKTLALLFGTCAVLTALGAFVQVNPIWIWGPYTPEKAISPAQPDWYVGWLEGALRVWPRMPIHLWGHFIPSIFWPGIALPFGIMGILLLYPFIEARITGDSRAHNLLDRPRDSPVRTALGASFFMFMLALFLAGSDDLQTRYTHIPLNVLLWFYRGLVLLGPALVFLSTYAIAAELKAHGGVKKASRVRLLRNADGGFAEEEIA